MTERVINQLLPDAKQIEKERIIAMLISSDSEMRDLAWELIKNKIKDDKKIDLPSDNGES